MTARDRLVLMTLIALAVLAAGWLLLVAPERKQAAQVQTQVSSARQQLASAQAQASEARSDQAKYTTAYASMVSLGKAVPAEEEVPSLIYQLDHASNQRDVDFNSISTGASAGTSPSASAAAAAAAAPAAFSQMPFTFVFKGSFYGLFHLLREIDSFAQLTSTGSVRVNGRLLTIQGADITLEDTASAGSTGQTSDTSAAAGRLSATITATAYVLPASQGLTGGATATSPAGTATASAATSTSSPSSPTTPAVVKGAP
jgi:Type II secretion system (T2SS), protein M